MSERIEFDLEDFPVNHPAAAQVLSLLGDLPIAISRQVCGPAGACYWIAEDIADQNAGKVRRGWMVEWLPDVYIQAMHHAVVELPTGQLVDVTAPQRSEPSDGITAFVPDDSIEVDLRWPVSLENRYVILVQDEDVEQAIAQYKINNSAMNEFTAWAKAVPGAQWSPQAGWTAPYWPEAPSDDPIGDSFRLMHEARRKIRDRYLGR